MRKGIAVVAAVAGLGLAGCSSGSEDGASQPAPPPSQPQPAKAVRQGPTKNVNLSDQCSVLPQDKAHQLGYDQPPIAENSAGENGCRYTAKPAGSPDGWITFIAADPTQTMQQLASRMPPGQQDQIAGYPAHVVDTHRSCFVVVDVSDHGSLYVHSMTRPGAQRAVSSACDASKPAAEAAVQNLQNG